MDRIARSPKQLGAALHESRRRLGLSQETVAQRIGVRQTTISRLESGVGGTPLKVLFDLFVVLDLELVVRARSHGTTRDLDRLLT